ncbi:threonine aldolase family protein [Propionibacteriaceae bacterium Y2011]
MTPVVPEGGTIDLRSDTVTRPTSQMREAMLRAEVGDDVYAEDPSVNALEAKVAALLGHEAGLFCVTGSLANLLGVAVLVQPGQELLCDARAHVVRAELGAHAALSGITTRTWPSADGRVDPDLIMDMAVPDAGPYLVSTAAVSVENTHNFASGSVQRHDQLVELSQRCRAAGIGLHLDGARLWNAHVASGVELAETGRLFDTVNVCFSKGLGAPVGSMIIGSAELITRARVLRKRFGAGWRQAGMLAAAASYAVDHHVARLADDHAAARALAERVAVRAPAAVNPAEVETNIVVFDSGERSAADVVAAAAERGVAVSHLGERVLRAVTHLDVSADDAVRAGEVLGDLLAPAQAT